MVKVDYPIGDFLIRLKNAVIAGNTQFEALDTKLTRSVADVLVSNRFLKDYTKLDGKLEVTLATHKKKPLIMNIKLISKPGLRIYMDQTQLKARRGPSLFILTTNGGVMTDKEAIKKNLGGEVIAEIW